MSALAIAGGAMALSALLGSQAAGKAAGQQSAAISAGIGEQGRQFDLTREDLAPWRETGTAATYTLGHMLGLPVPPEAYGAGPRPTVADFTTERNVPVMFQSPFDKKFRRFPAFFAGTGTTGGRTEKVFDKDAYDAATAEWNAALERGREAFPEETRGSLVEPYKFEETPEYDFIRSEAEKAVGRSKSTEGLRRSGAHSKALARFVGDIASTYRGEWTDRDLRNRLARFNMYSGVSTPGAQVATAGANIGRHIAANTSKLLAAQGDVDAAGTVGRVNPWIQGGNQFANLYFMNQFLKGPSATPVAPVSSTTAGFNANVPWRT